MKTIDSIKKIYIHREVADGVLARNVRERARPGMEIEIIDDPAPIQEAGMRSGDRGGEKDTVLLYKYNGKFMSACPGSDGMVCCNYAVINFGIGCLFDCHYCYLQNFMNNPLMTLFGNMEDLFTELDQRTKNKKHHFRIGTGEYTDSLALDELTGLSQLLVEKFAGMENATLELKTKSANVDALLDLDHRGRTVVAWSVNPPAVVDGVEDDTANLEERLAAAEKVQAAGYKLGFHLDPLIYFEGWEEEYHALIDRIFDRIDPDRVAWISTGSFRYAPGLKEIMQARFQDDGLTREEMVQGPDGKYRYFKTIRQEMYASVRDKIQSVNPRLFLYLCMETRRMWEKVFDFVPDSAKNLDGLFEQRRLYTDARLPAAAKSGT